MPTVSRDQVGKFYLHIAERSFRNVIPPHEIVDLGSISAGQSDTASMAIQFHFRALEQCGFNSTEASAEKFNLVVIRSDEKREGYISTKPNIRAVFPFREDDIDYAGVQTILTDAGIGMPPYTEWGRTRSGCFFCFYQQKVEWVRLKQRHPNLYEEAKAYEKPNSVNGNTFYWTSNESLANIEKPERMAEIEKNWEKSQKRLLAIAKRTNVTLAESMGGLSVETEVRSGCLICQL